MLKPGIYEQVINNEVNNEIKGVSAELIYSDKIDSVEASLVLTQYLSKVIKKSLDNLYEENDLSKQISAVNEIIDKLSNITKDDFTEYKIDDNGNQILAVADPNSGLVASGLKSAKDMIRPETSISRSELFTNNSKTEPRYAFEIQKEIASSDRIDILVSFIKWSGLRNIINELREFTDKGGKLRIITTTYMGATEERAVEELRKLKNTEIKVSYDTTRTRLHAKAYIFMRNSGFDTAYVGSSNISDPAMSDGLEWNVKVTAQDLPLLVDKTKVSFESYWNTSEYELYVEGSNEKLKTALASYNKDDSSFSTYIFDIIPYSYQQEILDKLEAERTIRGYYKNLVVAATGTGKTLISAFDYRNYCNKVNQGMPKLLFVAHREEILKQSINVFRAVLKDNNFGELWVGNYKPNNLDYLFVSIQTIESKKLYEKLSKDYYDYIIVDEFHHAAASTYEKMLNTFEPKILLGLTATPERMDGKSILTYFNNRIAAEIRLPEAIDKKLLCPFQYFGVSDTVDFSSIKWSRGGYDKSELTNVLALSEKISEDRAINVINSVIKYVTDINKVHGLGFCVSIEHANFMAKIFNENNIPSIALSSNSDDKDRKSAKSKLVKGDIKFIFVVDLYNEGVDIPEIDTVLFLRPTESLTIFLQQLGRGLRLCKGKDCLTVLDFIGQSNQKYNFESKFAALLDGSKRSVKQEIEKGFAYLPKGCYIHLEKQASDIILKNIENTYKDKEWFISRIKTFKEDSGLDVNLKNFVDFHNIPLEKIYKNDKYSFARLCVLAQELNDFSEPLEELISKRLKRILSIDSRRWIDFLINNLKGISIAKIKQMSRIDLKMMNMFYKTIWMENPDWNDKKTQSNINKLANSPNMVNEIIEILKYNFDHIDIVDSPVDLGFDCPLDTYCTYSRDQILMAVDCFAPVREGVKYVEDKKLDIFFITLNKSEKDYLSTTMYKDYAIDSEYFHWQSQNATSETSKTGKRYINHKAMGSKVLLFVRENKNDEFGPVPYTYLGTANYVSHIDNKPMSIIWKLDKPIPAKYLQKTSIASVG